MWQLTPLKRDSRGRLPAAAAFFAACFAACSVAAARAGLLHHRRARRRRKARGGGHALVPGQRALRSVWAPQCAAFAAGPAATAADGLHELDHGMERLLLRACRSQLLNSRIYPPASRRRRGACGGVRTVATPPVHPGRCRWCCTGRTWSTSSHTARGTACPTSGASQRPQPRRPRRPRACMLCFRVGYCLHPLTDRPSAHAPVYG